MNLDHAHRWVMEAGGQPLVRMPMEPPALAANEVVVAVAGCGVCHTDLGYYYDGVRTRQALPLALGHEVSGRVVEAGRVARTWIGRAVIVASVIPCDTCDACRRGRPAICPNQKMPGNDVHGGFATHVVVPVHGLCPVDEARLARIGLGLAEVAVLADAVTTPFQAVTRAGVGSGDLAIVVGVGGVGSHAVQIAAARGATVVAIDVDPDKLAKVAQYGAALTLDARAGDARSLKRAIAEFAASNGLRGTEWSIFECSGSAAGQLTAYDLLVPGSTLSVVGFTRAKIEVRLSNLMAFDARAIGTWGCPPGLYPDALELVLEGKVQLRPFVEMRPLASINAVFAEAHAGALSRRVVLVPDS